MATLEIIIIIFGLLEIAPLIGVVKAFKGRKMLKVPINLYSIGLIVSTMWIVCGFQLESLPIIITSIIMLMVNITVIVIYHIYKQKFL